jgi:hypothetical protein
MAMETSNEMQHSAKGLMYRSTALPLQECFIWCGVHVTIHTDSPLILSAVEAVGFTVQKSLDRRQSRTQPPAVSWEIAAERNGANKAERWECEVTRNGRSLYLSMGSLQWFAFDMETGDGAGFVIPGDIDEGLDNNVESYIRAIADNVGASLQSGLRGRR